MDNSISINKKALTQSIIFGIIALAIYCVTSKGLFTDMHVIRNAFAQLSFIPFAYFVHIVTRQSIFSRRWLPEYIIWLIWTLILPIAMYMEFTIARDFIRFKGETLFGNAILLGLILMRVIAFDWIKSKLAYAFYGLIYIAVWLVPIIQLIYHSIYGEFITPLAIIAIQQTDPREAMEWIVTYVKLPTITALGIFALLLGLAGPAYETYYRKRANSFIPAIPPKKSIVVLTIIIWGVTITKLFPMVGVIDQWKEQKYIQMQEVKFNDNYAERYESIDIHPTFSISKGTFVVIIGESASRDYMNVYNSHIKYNNTPWLSQMVADKNMVLFDNAYACYNLTKYALCTGLTEASQYNNTSFVNSMSIVDIAKKGGYKTYWFSNQLGEQFSEVPIQMIANRADVVRISVNEFDEGLLPLLSEVNPEDKNLIIIHLAGSHARYECRFPASERVFSEKTDEANYANTIHYTDKITREITEYAKNNLNLQAVLYYSDHGEDYSLGHGTATKKWSTLHIPMWIYITENYRQVSTTVAENLFQHKKSYFTNDMMFNTLSGLLGLPSNHYDPREDLTSDKYCFMKNSLFAFNRQLPISNDVGGDDFEYIDPSKLTINFISQ